MSVSGCTGSFDWITSGAFDGAGPPATTPIPTKQDPCAPSAMPAKQLLKPWLATVISNEPVSNPARTNGEVTRIGAGDGDVADGERRLLAGVVDQDLRDAAIADPDWPGHGVLEAAEVDVRRRRGAYDRAGVVDEPGRRIRARRRRHLSRATSTCSDTSAVSGAGAGVIVVRERR